MSSNLAHQLHSFILEHYELCEFPLLHRQWQEWSITKPLNGLHIIDSSPIFRNSCAKYAALLSAGAQLSLAVSELMPHDKSIVALLKSWGFPVLMANEVSDSFDIVMDCAGSLAHVTATLGYVELTKSGAQHYSNCSNPVWMVDAGRIKQIETCLGTGAGFFRALNQLEISLPKNARILIIGGGKVGTGIALHAYHNNYHVTIADVSSIQLPHPDIHFLHIHDATTLTNAILNSDCAVTATGKRHALENLILPSPIVQSATLLANMGVENEWSSLIPRNRILNNGLPTNFILDDPTQMCFIDPPLALHNQGALELSQHRVPTGLFTPPAAIENEFLNFVSTHGCIPHQLLSWLN